jgi:hypothetical protein
MTAAEKSFRETGESIKDAEEGQMFGKPCFKVNGKAFSCFYENCMVFKLEGDSHAEALKLKEAKLFDPSGKGRAMKEWVQVTEANSKDWTKFATAAAAYVKKNN